MIWLLIPYLTIGISLGMLSVFLIRRPGPILYEITSFLFLALFWPFIIIYGIWDCLRRYDRCYLGTDPKCLYCEVIQMFTCICQECGEEFECEQPCTSCGAYVNLHGQHKKDCIFHPDIGHKIGNELRIRLPRDYNIQEKKMTRNEACRIVEQIYGKSNKGMLVDSLIALGVLKVVEEEKSEIILQEIISKYRLKTVDSISFIEGLKKEGYEIVKKGNSNA